MFTGSSVALAHSYKGHIDLWLSHRDQNPESLPQKNIGNEILYQVFVDRFSNGNRQNDCLFDGRFCDPTQQDFARYFGGDLRGLINKMPYLKDLGITRLWMTPIFDSQNVIVEAHKHGRDWQFTSYHGYWFKDLFRFNPIFTDRGTQDKAILKELIETASPEIRLYLDTVANHSSPTVPTQESVNYLESISPLDRSDGINRTHIGALFRDGTYFTSITEDFQRKSMDWNYSPLFHHYGIIDEWDNQYEVENFQLDGLADLAQENPKIQQYTLDAHVYWLREFPGLAGYRMDTIKHVPHWYWKKFNDDLFQVFPDAEIVGEYFGGGNYNAGSYPYYLETNMSMFDFDFRASLENTLVYDASFTQITNMWANDHRLKDARSLVTFIDNHDLPRMRGAPYNRISYQRMRQAINLLFVSRGIPCVYYGLEQDLFYPEDLGDPYNRPMMSSFNQQHEFYKQIKALIKLRKDNEALRYGSTHVVHLSYHILGFERVYGDQKVFMITSKNPIPGKDVFSVRNLTMPDGAYTDVLTGKTYEVKNGTMPISIGNGESIIIATENPKS